MDMKTVWHLEDAKITAVAVKQALEQKVPGCYVRQFLTRLQLEDAWKHETRPDFLILDLLVPEQYVWLVRILLGRPTTPLQKFMHVFTRLGAKVLARFYGERYLRRLDRQLCVGKRTDWGGLEFLRERKRRNDWGQSDPPTQICVYSQTANDAFLRANPQFAALCVRIRQELEQLRSCESLTKLNRTIRIVAKGYIETNRWGIATDRLIADDFNQLVDCIGGSST